MREAKVDFNRRWHCEDALFMVALAVPPAVSTVRTFDSERQIAQIARAAGTPSVVALNVPPASTLEQRVQATLALHASLRKPALERD
jgi:hypothetical protein